MPYRPLALTLLRAPRRKPPRLATLSPTLNTGDEATCEAGRMLRFDASGIALVRPLDGRDSDIGAYESSSTPDVIFRYRFH